MLLLVKSYTLPETFLYGFSVILNLAGWLKTGKCYAGFNLLNGKFTNSY